MQELSIIIALIAAIAAWVAVLKKNTQLEKLSEDLFQLNKETNQQNKILFDQYQTLVKQVELNEIALNHKLTARFKIKNPHFKVCLDKQARYMLHLVNVGGEAINMKISKHTLQVTFTTEQIATVSNKEEVKIQFSLDKKPDLNILLVMEFQNSIGDFYRSQIVTDKSGKLNVTIPKKFTPSRNNLTHRVY